MEPRSAPIYIAERSADGWATHGITPKQEPLNSFLVFNGPGDAPYEGEFSEDLSHGVVRANAFPNGDPNVSGVENLFLGSDLLAPDAASFSLISDSVSPIAPYPIDGSSDSTYRPAIAGASADFGHIIFETRFNLTQQAIDAGLPTKFFRDEKLYEWDHGTVRLVGILPASEGGGVATRAIAGKGANRISPFYTWDMISDDGSRILFTVPVLDGDETRSAGQLYMRENHTTTVRINASERSSPNPCQPEPQTCPPAIYRGATPDGSYIFFNSAETLTDSAPNGGLYRYDAGAPEGEHLTLISADEDASDGVGGRELGMVGASDDGEWVYFVATDSRLVSGAPIPNGLSKPVLYGWHNGTLRYVAKLFDQALDFVTNTDMADWQFHSKTGRVTPDGKHLLFLTFEGNQIAPHDHGNCLASSIGSVEPCREVYVYSAEADGGQGQLSCASCPPSGAPGTGDAGVSLRANAGAARTTSHFNHPLSSDGRWAFFGTAQPLLPEDSNTSIDVYEYDVATGNLYLLSTGNPDAGNAYFMDASPSGKDVFFATQEQLGGQDTDASYDLYDARVGGGLVTQNLLGTAAACVADACRTAVDAPPTTSTPASVSYQGKGNVKHHRPRRKKHRHKRYHEKPQKHSSKRGQK